MNPLDAIKALTSPEQPTTTYWECQGCGKTGTGPFPAVCECGARCWPGNSPEEAHARVNRVKGIQPTVAPSTAPTPAPVSEPVQPTPAPVEPEPTTKRGRKPKSEQAKAPQEKVESIQSEPSRINSAQAAAASTESTEQAESVAEPPANPTDYALLRQQFAQSHGLVTDQYKPVGEGKVGTLGFTIWMREGEKATPMFRWMEPTDTPESFKAEYNRALEKFGSSAVRFDTLRIGNLSPVALKQIAFQGELTSGRNAGDGPVYVQRGDRVRIGARLSKTGSVIFCVLNNLTKENE